MSAPLIGKGERPSRAKLVAAVAGASALAACVGLAGTSSSAERTVLSPIYTPNTKPTLQWNGLPEKYKFDPFVDSEHTDDYYTKDNKDAWGPKGQYGMWMGIQGDTINGFGCGPKGPHDCSVGTTPGEHWARGRKGLLKQQQLAAVPQQRTQKLSPVYSPNTKPDLVWNGLPENYKNDLFRDSEHMDDLYTKNGADPFGPKGQYGMWMGIQGDTINDWGCGPGGPMDCSVGTTPGEHWARRPAQRKEGQKLKVNIAKGATLPATISWNGLGEKTNPFAENPDEQVTADPFNSKGQFGAYMGIQDDTRYPGASWGCGPNGPLDCTVGTSPAQHWARQGQMAMQGMQGMQVVDIPDAEVARMGLLQK